MHTQEKKKHALKFIHSKKHEMKNKQTCNEYTLKKKKKKSNEKYTAKKACNVNILKKKKTMQ